MLFIVHIVIIVTILHNQDGPLFLLFIKNLPKLLYVLFNVSPSNSFVLYYSLDSPSNNACICISVHYFDENGYTFYLIMMGFFAQTSLCCVLLDVLVHRYVSFSSAYQVF